MKNFHEKNVIQINDTHPALVIPELMRILIDDAGLSWEEAWHITTHSVAYTNHTVLAEALECWPQSLFEQLLPRPWQIIQEIAHRWQKQVEEFYHDPEKTEKMAIVWDGAVRMANLCIAGGMAVNGVSALHSDILRTDVFKDACGMEPEKFRNVTNGVDHRRWLSQSNPGLDGLLRGRRGVSGRGGPPARAGEVRGRRVRSAPSRRDQGGEQAALRALGQAPAGCDAQPGQHLQRTGQAPARV